MTPILGLEVLVPETQSESFITRLPSGGHERWEMAYPASTDPRDNPLVIIKGGFTTRLENYSGLTRAVASLGYTAVNCDALRDLPLTRAMHPKHLAHPLRRQSQAVWGVMHDLQDRGFTATPNLVGHSMGGFVMLDAAVHHPDTVGTVVMLESAALGHRRTEICLQFASGLITDALPNGVAAYRRGEHGGQLSPIVRQLGRHGLQVLHEGLEIMGTDARPLITEHIASGHPVKFIFGTRDRVIGSRCHEAVRALDPNILVIDAGHTAPQFQAVLTAAAIDRALSPPSIPLPRSAS